MSVALVSTALRSRSQRTARMPPAGVTGARVSAQRGAPATLRATRSSSAQTTLSVAGAVWPTSSVRTPRRPRQRARRRRLLAVVLGKRLGTRCGSDRELRKTLRHRAAWVGNASYSRWSRRPGVSHTVVV